MCFGPTHNHREPSLTVADKFWRELGKVKSSYKVPTYHYDRLPNILLTRHLGGFIKNLFGEVGEEQYSIWCELGGPEGVASSLRVGSKRDLKD